MKKRFKNPLLLAEVIIICIISSFLAADSYAGEQLPRKSETVTERMYGESLPAAKKMANSVDIEISEILLGNESGYNKIWSREEKLDLKTRELCTISMLGALGRSEELLTHISCAVRLGWALNEIKETHILCIISAGWPKALNALRTWGKYCEVNKIPVENGQSIREDFYARDWFKTGNEKGIQLFGKNEWNAFYSELSAVDAFLADFTVSNHYGKLYTRTVLDEKTKSLCIMSAYAALRSKRSLRLSIIAALNSGASRDQIKELLFHAGGYAGQEAALDAIEVFKSIKS